MRWQGFEKFRQPVTQHGGCQFGGQVPVGCRFVADPGMAERVRCNPSAGEVGGISDHLAGQGHVPLNQTVLEISGTGGRVVMACRMNPWPLGPFQKIVLRIEAVISGARHGHAYHVSIHAQPIGIDPHWPMTNKLVKPSQCSQRALLGRTCGRRIQGGQPVQPCL